MLQGAEALVKDVTALGRWPLDIKNNPTERILIRRIRELRDAHASGALQSALDGAAQPTVIAQLEDLQRKFLQETADRMLGEAEEAVDPNLAFAEGEPRVCKRRTLPLQRDNLDFAEGES